MRISRPGITYLNPYIDRSNPTMLTYGNPDLDTEKTHNIGLTFNSFSAKMMLNVSLRHSFTDNAIEQFSFYDSNNLLNMTYDSDAVYNRGAVIVNTMMNYMGRETFLEAMRAYFQQYAYQTATSEQLCEALTQYSGIDMHGFFDTYVYSSGMPHLYAVIKSVEQAGEWTDHQCYGYDWFGQWWCIGYQ